MSCSTSWFPPILGSYLNSRLCSGKSWIFIKINIFWENSWILIDNDILITQILNLAWWVKTDLALPWRTYKPFDHTVHKEDLNLDMTSISSCWKLQSKLAMTSRKTEKAWIYLYLVNIGRQFLFQMHELQYITTISFPLAMYRVFQ